MVSAAVVACAQSQLKPNMLLVNGRGGGNSSIVELFLPAHSSLDVLSEVRGRKPGQYAFVLSTYATDEMRGAS